MKEPVSADWAQMSHQELYAQITAGPGPGISDPVAGLWSGLREILDDHQQRFTAALNASRGEWTGQAAEAAHGSMQSLSDWAGGAADDAATTLQAVTDQGAHAGWVRTAMPPPPTAPASSGYSPYSGGGVLSRNAFQQEAAEATNRARDVMRTYAGNSTASQGAMSMWAVPPAVTVDIPPPGAARKSASGSGHTAPAAVHSAGAGPGAASTGAPSTAAPVSPVPGTPTPDTAAPIPPTAATLGQPVSPTTRPSTAGSPTPGAGSSGTASTGIPGATRLPGVADDVPDARSLAPGVGGRGTRPIAPATFGGTSAADPPRNGAATSWRDVIAQQGRGGAVAENGGRVTEPARPSLSTAEPEVARSGARPGAAGLGGAMIPPMMGTGGGQGREHRRPGYLVDDTGAFADDRWYTQAVITPDDPLPDGEQ